MFDLTVNKSLANFAFDLFNPQLLINWSSDHPSRPLSLQKMWLALFYGLKSRIKMDGKTREAWFRVFRFLAGKIIEGMRKAKYDAQLTNSTFANYNQIQ